MSTFEERHQKSIKGFDDFVRPWIEEFCGFEVMSAIEKLDNSGTSKLLDMRGSLDYIIQDEQQTLYGLASRINYQDKTYNNFTVRATGTNGQPTEYNRLRLASKKGGILPKYMVSAFIYKDGSSPIAVAMAQTTDILNLIDQGRSRYTHGFNGCDSYHTVFWSDLIQDNADMWLTNFERKEYHTLGSLSDVAA